MDSYSEDFKLDEACGGLPSQEDECEEFPVNKLRCEHTQNLCTLLQLVYEKKKAEFLSRCPVSPLGWCCMEQSTTVVKRMLQLGASPMIKDASNLYAIDHAIGQPENVKLLVEFSATENVEYNLHLRELINAKKFKDSKDPKIRESLEIILQHLHIQAERSAEKLLEETDKESKQDKKKKHRKNKKKTTDRNLGKSSDEQDSFYSPDKQSYMGPSKDILGEKSSDSSKTTSRPQPSLDANGSLSEVLLPPVTSSEQAKLATPSSSSRSASGIQPLNDFSRSNQINNAAGGLDKSIETIDASFPIGNITEEQKEEVGPGIGNVLTEPQGMDNKETQQRSNIDQTPVRVLNSSTMDVLATAAGDAIYQQMQQAYTNMFTSTMFPLFQATLAKTVTDIHGIFQQGMMEYQLKMRHTMVHMLRERMGIDDVAYQMEASRQKLLQTVEEMKPLVVENIRTQVARALTSTRDNTINDTRKVIKQELALAVNEHGAVIRDRLTAYLRSEAAEVSPEVEHSKERIAREFRMGRARHAFEYALVAGNIKLLLLTCEVADSYNIFEQNPCGLTQQILMQLIIQLSADLEKCFDLKIKFLLEAVVNLDASQKTTADSIPQVLRCLRDNIHAAQAHRVDARMFKHMKLVYMAATSLLKLVN